MKNVKRALDDCIPRYDWADMWLLLIYDDLTLSYVYIPFVQFLFNDIHFIYMHMYLNSFIC